MEFMKLSGAMVRVITTTYMYLSITFK